MATETNQHETETPEGVEPASARAVFRPPVDIVETPDAVLLVADLPGVDEAGTEVTLEKNVLTIRGTANPPQYAGFSPIYTEYEFGDFERAFTVSAEIDRERIEATVKDGVLRIRLPKAKQAAARKINVTGA